MKQRATGTKQKGRKETLLAYVVLCFCCDYDGALFERIVYFLLFPTEVQPRDIPLPGKGCARSRINPSKS